MKSNKIISTAVLAFIGLTTGLVQSAAAADKPAGDTHTGTAKVKLEYVYALKQTGSADPAHDAACKKQLSMPESKYVGMPVTTKYSIDPKTLIMSATSSFPSPVSTQPLELNVDLNALGIAGSYSFGAFRPNVLPAAYSIMFSTSLKFTDAKSTFVIFGPKDQEYNCLISSAKMPFKAAESAKYGVDAK